MGLILTCIAIGCAINYRDNSNKKAHILDITKYSYAKFYSLARENRMLFDFHLKDLDKKYLTVEEKEKLDKICNFHIEDGIERLEVAQGYDCLVRLHIKDNPTLIEIFKAIKNASYGLDTLYTLSGAINLANLIIKGHEKEISDLVGKDIHQYYTGYTKDEIPFLNKLITLNIPQLSAKSLYRLSMIHILGRSSFNEEKIEPDLKLAISELQEVKKIVKIKPDNILDIALTINDKFASPAATTIASVLLNADLDSFYRFHIVMNPDDPVSLESQEKLASMKYIRDYSIEFIKFPNEIIPVELVKKVKLSKTWPLIVMYRLYLDQIFPNQNSMLYIDSDMIILRDLNSFKRINMDNYIAAGSFDQTVGQCFSKIRAECKKNIYYSYKNSGILFLNLQMMRNININKALLKTIANSKCNFLCPDQDLLNLSFHDYIYNLSARWNFLTVFNHKNPYFSYFVGHYAGRIKPWSTKREELWHTNPTELDETIKQYWRYKELTPWPVLNDTKAQN